MCRLSIDLLRDWDEDGNGLVDRDEFFKALPVLGIFVSKADADELFGLFDTDGSGTIDYRELNRLLRRRVVAEKRMRRSASEGTDSHYLMPPGPARSFIRTLAPLKFDPMGSQTLPTTGSDHMIREVTSSIQRFGPGLTSTSGDRGNASPTRDGVVALDPTALGVTASNPEA